MQFKTSPWPEIVKLLIEKNPEAVGRILEAVSYMIAGNPKQIEADSRLEIRTTVGFMTLMGIILAITTVLAVLGRVSGDAVAFILGTAFGSMITFLYRFLTTGKGEE